LDPFRKEGPIHMRRIVTEKKSPAIRNGRNWSAKKRITWELSRPSRITGKEEARENRREILLQANLPPKNPKAPTDPGNRKDRTGTTFRRGKKRKSITFSRKKGIPGPFCVKK